MAPEIIKNEQKGAGKPFFIWLMGCALLLVPAFHALGSDNVLKLYPSLKRVDLTKYLYFVREPKDKRLSIKEVSATGFASSFVPVPTNNFGFVNDVFWLRLSLKNESPFSLKRFVEIDFPFIDRIEFYEPLKNGYKLHLTGRRFPFGTRDIKHRDFVFVVSIPPGTHNLFIRIETESAMFFPSTLWSPKAFWEKEQDAQFVFGMYYGILAVMAIFNFFVFISLQDSSYFYYVLFILFFGLYQMTANGFAYEYLWPQAVWWNRHSTILFASVAMLSAVLFAKKFLKSKDVMPRLDKIMTLFIWAVAVLAGLSMFISYKIMVQVAVFFGAIFISLLVSAGILGLRNGQRSARFFILAWSVLLLGCMILILRNIGLLGANFFVLYAIQFGSVFDVVLLSFALADRINELRRDRELAFQQIMAHKQQIETQREAMIRELHDGIGALTSNISLLAAKAKEMAGKTSIEGELSTIGDLARQGRAEIDSFMQCLDEGEQDPEALQAELRYLGNRLVTPHGISFVLKGRVSRGKEKINPFVWLSVIKIYQEALTNVVKHSKASNVEVEFIVSDGRLELHVRDDGVGISGEYPHHGMGRGLTNMKKRAAILGGKLTVTGESGTYIRLEIPLWM